MKVVTFGGGSSQPELIKHLKEFDLEITAVFSTADSGGSTGVLRDELGVMPPGDLRRGLISLATENLELAQAMAYRFQEGSLSGQNFGNILLATLEKSTGDFSQGVKALENVLKTKGHCLPSSLEATQLYAELENGEVIKGETNIDIPKHDGELTIDKVWLDPKVKANPEVIKAIQEAELIIYCLGDLYTSLLPNLLAQGVSEALQESKAPKIYTSNLTTKKGETHNFSILDFVKVVEKYSASKIDYVTVNNKALTPPDDFQLVSYDAAKTKAHGVKVVEADLAHENGYMIDEEKLAKTIWQEICPQFS